MGSRVDRAAQNSGCCRSPIASEKLQHIVPKTYQIPLRVHLTQTPQQELPEPSHLLDLTENRFTDPLALRINRPAFERSKLSAHTFLKARIFRNSSPRRRQRLVSVLDPSSGHISINLLLRQIAYVFLAEVATVGGHLSGFGTFEV
jgi:hypothetical protein